VRCFRGMGGSHTHPACVELRGRTEIGAPYHPLRRRCHHRCCCCCRHQRDPKRAACWMLSCGGGCCVGVMSTGRSPLPAECSSQHGRGCWMSSRQMRVRAGSLSKHVRRRWSAAVGWLVGQEEELLLCWRWRKFWHASGLPASHPDGSPRMTACHWWWAGGAVACYERHAWRWGSLCLAPTGLCG
jgi:hypothetical protein